MDSSNERKATIKDICQKTGLAIGTVSKYLNGGSLRKANAEKIKNAIIELDYKVDIYARGMKTKKTNTVGVLLPQLGNAFYGSIATAIGLELQKYGYEMLVQETNYEHNRELECLNGFIERRTDGIICFLLSEDLSQFSQFSDEPIVFIERQVKEFNAETVNVNNREIVKEIITHLIEQGHTKIAGFFPSNSYTGEERIKGFKDAFKIAKIPLSNRMIHYFDEKESNEYSVISKVIDSDAPTAIFMSNYTSTLSAIFLINERKIKIPDDISIICFDNMMFTKLFTPKLTIVNQPLEQIASTAVSRVVELIENKSSKRRNNILKCSLIPGNSVKKLAN